MKVKARTFSGTTSNEVTQREIANRALARKAAAEGFVLLKNEEQILPLLKKGLCVSIYTQLTDVELEVNGLFTYDRAVCKLDEAVVKEINQKLVL